MRFIMTPRSNKTNCNSIEMPYDDNDRHTFINSKYYDFINELNAHENKANYFGILHLNTVSLNKHVDSLPMS